MTNSRTPDFINSVEGGQKGNTEPERRIGIDIKGPEFGFWSTGSEEPFKILSQRNANQNHKEVPSHISQNGCYQKVYKQTLQRVQRKGNPLTLLVGMQTSTVTTENSVEIPLKIENRTAIWPSNPTAKHIPQGTQNWKRHRYPSVHCSTICN